MASKNLALNVKRFKLLIRCHYYEIKLQEINNNRLTAWTSFVKLLKCLFKTARSATYLVKT